MKLTKPLIVVIFFILIVITTACNSTSQLPSASSATPTLTATNTEVPTAVPTAEKTPVPPTPTAQPTMTTAPYLVANSKAMSNGLILFNAQDTDKLRLNDVPNFYTAAKEKYTSTDLNKPVSDLPYTIQVNTAKQTLIWFHGWCGSTQTLLQDTMIGIDMGLMVNNQAVDLASVLQKDYKSSTGQFCRGMWLAVSGWPEGQTIIEFKTLSSAKSLKETFTMTYGFAKSTSISTSTGSDQPTIASLDDTEKEIASSILTYLEDAADGANLADRNLIERYFNTSRVFSIFIPFKQKHLVWATGWCAADKATLQKNLESIRFELSLNDQKMDLANFLMVDYQAPGSLDYCRKYATVLYNWPSGTTAIISKTILPTGINNGHQAYPAGEIVRRFIVKFMGN